MSAPQFTPPPVGARRVFLILDAEPITFALVDDEPDGAEAAPPSSITRSSDDSLTLHFGEALTALQREGNAPA